MDIYREGGGLLTMSLTEKSMGCEDVTGNEWGGGNRAKIGDGEEPLQGR